jgi:hypothetical protein
MDGELRHACRFLLGNPEGEKRIGRRGIRTKNNIKKRIRKVGYKGVDWIVVAQAFS